eukprot:9580532-Lingulodinium_polyedra.AAC.1
MQLLPGDVVIMVVGAGGRVDPLRGRGAGRGGCHYQCLGARCGPARGGRSRRGGELGRDGLRQGSGQ